MGGFRTRYGRFVVERGEICLEPLGLYDWLGRRYKNAKLAHKERYERGFLRFVVVLLLGIVGLGQFVYRLLSGGTQSMLFELAIVAAVLGLIYGYILVRRYVRRRFRGFTTERTIPLRTIETVDPRPKGWFRGPHFIIHYDEYGTEKRRYVGVCTLTPLAEDEFETAKVIFLDEADLPITPA